MTDIPRIMLAHGGGGELTARLIEEHILPALRNERLETLDDAAILPWEAGEVVFTTDSYVVTPLEFPGGDIGRLAVAGTVNDLAVMGAVPVALSLGLILEEGLPIDILDRVMASIAETARLAGVPVVTGDTKVIERRSGDGLFINTAGVGRLLLGPTSGTGAGRYGREGSVRPPCRTSVSGNALDVSRVQAGDAILFSGTLADHGLTIMSVRGGIAFDSDLRSDAMPLNAMIRKVIESGAAVRFLRDATRGGLAGVLADISEATGLNIEIDETALPITSTARLAAEMLGLDPITVANEGKIVCVVANDDAAQALDVMRSTPEGRNAAVIGRVTDAQPPMVELNTRAGGRRIVQRPYGEELPRIC